MLQQSRLLGPVWNLPLHWLNTGVGMKIGGVLGEAKEVTIPNFGGNKDRHLKVFSVIDISQPLMRGLVIEMGGVSKWVEFKYEKCPNFCFKCGIIGHNEKVAFKGLKEWPTKLVLSLAIG
ncbi:hypothetical protein ACH5RR_034290 [Cinchona calisaya]|uniref:Zinc knuckle CX2CX4HX4C domain-containing protein n=1 Tax=Cinchona calisaya TaxID=153742 RepID=A0ABD2YAF7_9GENT